MIKMIFWWFVFGFIGGMIDASTDKVRRAQSFDSKLMFALKQSWLGLISFVLNLMFLKSYIEKKKKIQSEQ